MAFRGPRHALLRRARRLRPRAAPARADVAAPLRVPAARLRRLLRPSAELCKAHLPEIPDQHIAQMVAGIDVLLFRPDAELRRLARLARSRRGSTRAFSRAARRRRSSPSCTGARPAATGSRSSRPSRTRGSTWARATASTTTTAAGSTIPCDPLLGDSRARRRARRGSCTPSARPRRSAQSATASREEYGALLRRAGARHLRRAARALAHRLPLRRGAQVLLRLLVPDALLEQDPRVRRAARDARLPRTTREDVFQLDPPRGRRGARRALLTWAHGGRRAGPHHWPPIVERRRAAARAAEAVDAAAGAGDDADRGDQRPDDDDALGGHAGASAGAGRAR